MTSPLATPPSPPPPEVNETFVSILRNIDSLACRIEVAAALAAADGKAGQGILEDLLKSQELDDTDIDRR